jgi:PKD repeat protein
MITSGVCNPVYSNVIEVLVNPLPLATLTGGEVICPGQSSALNVAIPVGTGPFELDIENYPGLTVTGFISGSDIIVTPVSTTTYRLLRIRDANGCVVTSPSLNLMGTATVTVREMPALTASPVNKTICEYGFVSFNSTVAGSDLTYQWYVNEGSGFIALTDEGVYAGSSTSSLSIFGATRLMDNNVYHVVASGCSASVTSGDAVLTVNTAPEIQSQPQDTVICLNGGAAFSVDATGSGISYQWQRNSGTGFVNVTDDANINGSTSNTLTISNASVLFNNNFFRVILTGSCGAPVYSNFANLRVQMPPMIMLNPVSKAICDGGIFVSFTASGAGQLDSLRWQVLTGGIWSDIHDNAIYSGSSSQQLTLTGIPLSFNGNQYRLGLKAKCTIVYSNAATLTVNPNPVVDFSAISPISACGGTPIVLQGNPAGGSGTYTQHLWTGDVGPLNSYYVESPTFNPSMSGSYVMNYKVKDTNGCFGDDDITINVDSPSADFIKSIQSGCTPLAVSFTKDMAGIDKFWWNFGDGSAVDSVNTNPTHSFANLNPASLEYFDITLTVRSAGGCRDTYTSSVMVYPESNAAFTASRDTVCSGGSISFTSAPGAGKYFWDYGDGDSGYSLTETTTHTFINFTTNPVIRTVRLTTTSFYNCNDTRTYDIVVMPVPVPQFTAAPVTQVYNPAGNQVSFGNITNAGTWIWSWNFDDGTSSTDRDPVHTFTNVGSYKVTLHVNNSVCSDSIKHTVSVTPIPPVAGFDSVASGCTPLYITLNNTSLNTDTPGTTYYWSFGDGSISTSKNPTYTYLDPGIYRIELTVTGPGGTSTYSRIVEAYSSPIASLKVAPTFVFVNDEPVRFFNLSQGAASFIWDFGDGDTSRLKEPLHKYMEEGIYDITLWAYSSNGCVDQYVLSPGVTVEPAGELRFGTVFRPNLTGPVDLDHLPTGTEVDMFFYPPIREKVLEYKLQVFNRWGVLIFESRDINKPWNGYYQNKLCPQGVYVWYVEGKYANGSLFKKAGDITILH